MVKTWTRHNTTEIVLNNGWRLAVGGCWRLVAVGGWRLAAVGGWWSLGAVLTKKKLAFLSTALRSSGDYSDKGTCAWGIQKKRMSHEAVRDPDVDGAPLDYRPQGPDGLHSFSPPASASRANGSVMCVTRLGPKPVLLLRKISAAEVCPGAAALPALTQSRQSAKIEVAGHENSETRRWVAIDSQWVTALGDPTRGG